MLMGHLAAQIQRSQRGQKTRIAPPHHRVVEILRSQPTKPSKSIAETFQLIHPVSCSFALNITSNYFNKIHSTLTKTMQREIPIIHNCVHIFFAKILPGKKTLSAVRDKIDLDTNSIRSSSLWWKIQFLKCTDLHRSQDSLEHLNLLVTARGYPEHLITAKETEIPPSVDLQLWWKCPKGFFFYDNEVHSNTAWIIFIWKT